MAQTRSHFLQATAHRLRKVRRSIGQAFGGGKPAPDGWQPAGGPVLVIAAHPDDEVIGCGGAVYRHSLAGDNVSVIYLTRGHGSRGFYWLTPEERGAVRELEARSSSRILGVKETLFLEGREDHLEDPDARPEWVTQIAQTINRLQPRVIYVPHAADNHRDHVAAHHILLDAARATGGQNAAAIIQYEIWSPLAADFAVDITPYMSRKLRAIRCHRLAMDAFNYIPTIKGLAAYRCGTLLQRHGYAEAFERLKPIVTESAVQ